MDLRLDEIVDNAALNAQFTGDAYLLGREIASVSVDSRLIRAGELFFALKGARYDAHDYVGDVIQKGALAAVVDRAWQEKSAMKGPLILVNDTLKALQAVSAWYRRKFHFPFLAITGSNGKTTTKEMAVSVLSQKFSVLKNRGNLNNHIGVPLTLCELDHRYNLGVIEIGISHFHEMTELAEIVQPNYGLITNIAAAHLEFFGTLAGVARAKTELWRYLEANDGIAFVNHDDPFLSTQMPSTKKVITYSFERAADVQGEYLGMDDRGFPAFRALDTKIKLKIAGRPNIYNALSAVAIGLEFGIAMEDIREALEAFSPASKRMETIREHGITILNDCYNANPSSTESALITLSQIRTNGLRIAVLGDMLELGDTSEFLHRQIGARAVELKVDHLLAYGQLSRFTVEEAKARGHEHSIHFDDKKKLAEYLKNIISSDDIILIKGSRGMAMEDVTAALLNSN